MSKKIRVTNRHGFTLVEILVALVISSLLAAAIYSFFIGQHHAYTVQDQVIEMEQNARAAMDMIRKELRMAGYHAMGDDLINNLSDFVPSSFIPTSPVTVNLDANPKISEGSGTDPDVITFLSVLPTSNNPTVLKEKAEKGDTFIIVDLTKSKGEDQYNEGDVLHIGTCSDYAKIEKIEFVSLPSETYQYTKLTIDTNPADSTVNPGLSRSYEAGVAVGEIYVVSYAVFNDDNDPSNAKHDPGHPVLKRNANGGGFQPVAENITDMQLQHLGSGEIEISLSSRTDRADHKFQSNGGYRAYTTNATVKVRNADTVAVGTTCAKPSAPSNLTLTGLDDTYPCQIHITWDAATGTTGCEVSKYIVYYGTTSSAYAYSADVGNVTAYTLDVTALKACTYYVAVAAVNSAGTGPKSAEQSITDDQSPAIPTGFSADNINGVERRVVLSWDMNTECDLQGYRINGRINGADFPEDTFISKAFTNFSGTINDTTTDLTIDCDTYNYSIEAADFCPNLSGATTEIAVSPTPPAPPTGPVFRSLDSTDTISWTPSTDDFLIAGVQNYIVEYHVYGPAGDLLGTVDSGEDTTWTSTSKNEYYEVSAYDACDKESGKLKISSSCIDFPSIGFQDLEDNDQVSGTITIEGTATAIPSERTITRVSLTIDDDPPLTILNSSDWAFEWDTTKVADGDHTIKIRATDSEGCYSVKEITVEVDNPASVTPQVFCTLFTCKDPGNNPINLVVYVYDHEDEPVTGASVEANILFGPANNSSKIIPATTTAGYYGGDDTAVCTLYSTDPEALIPTGDLAIKSKSKYQDGTKTTIIINVAKEGFLGSTCTIDAQ